MTSSASPRISRTPSAARLAEETSVTSCGEQCCATLKHPYNEMYRRNIRDKLRVEIDVQATTDKDTMSAMVKLTDEIGESTSDTIDYGMVPNSRRVSTTSCREQCSLSFSRSGDCWMQVRGLPLKSRLIHMKRPMHLNPNKVSTAKVRVNEETRRTTL